MGVSGHQSDISVMIPVLSLLISAAATATAQNSISSCPLDSTCIPIKSCDPIIDQLSIAKETADTEKKRKIISSVRSLVCGDRADRLICCPQPTPASPALVKIGSFKNIYHNIGGEAYALDATNILIKDFTYDGEGPDAFFLAVTSRSSSDLSTGPRTWC